MDVLTPQGDGVKLLLPKESQEKYTLDFDKRLHQGEYTYAIQIGSFDKIHENKKLVHFDIHPSHKNSSPEFVARRKAFDKDECKVCKQKKEETKKPVRRSKTTSEEDSEKTPPSGPVILVNEGFVRRKYVKGYRGTM